MPAARIQWIDFCRVYVAFCVVVRHTDRYPDTLMYFTDLFNFRSLVFFFFLMSGYFTHAAAPGQWLDWKRFRKLISPYLFWALVPALLILLMLNWPAAMAGDWSWCSNPDMLLGYMGVRHWLYWDFLNVPLWFLRTLLLLALSSPLLQRIPTRAMLPLLVALFAASDVLCHLDAEAAQSLGRRGIPELPFRLYESVLATGFYAAGLTMRRHATPAQLTAFFRCYAWLPPILSLILFAGVCYWGFYPPILSSALVLMGVWTSISIGCLCEQYLPRFCHAVAQWGPAAFFLYVVHFPLYRVIKYALTGDVCGHLSHVQAYLAPVAITLASFALYGILRRYCPRFMQIFALVPRPEAGVQEGLSSVGGREPAGRG